MRRCISSERKEYNEQEQFASYTVEKRGGTRSYIVQFVREQGGSETTGVLLHIPTESNSNSRNLSIELSPQVN